MSLQTGADIFRHSLQVFRQQPALLVFPLLTMAMGLAIFSMLLPAVFNVSRVDAWHALWRPGEGEEAMRAIAESLRKYKLWNLPLGWLLAAYLLAKLGATFINCAFYSQAINALNGGHVHPLRGFRLAVEKTGALIPWALLAGSLGGLMGLFERSLGFLTFILVEVIGTSLALRRVSVMPSLLLGVPWHAASEFAIPAMLNEPRRLSPIGYLKISAQMLRRVWGEALVAGIVGPTAVGYICASVVVSVSMMVAEITDHYALLSWGLLLGFATWCLASAAHGVYRCGLYIYATEGVVPDAFDADLIERSWVVK